MKTPPFNTGKVLIGSHYEPPRRYEASLDMEQLQTALIERRDGLSFAATVIYAVIGFISIVVLLR
jgi:hypothetical protein